MRTGCGQTEGQGRDKIGTSRGTKPGHDGDNVVDKGGTRQGTKCGQEQDKQGDRMRTRCELQQADVRSGPKNWYCGLAKRCEIEPAQPEHPKGLTGPMYLESTS